MIRTALLLLIPSLGLAFEHTGKVWDAQDMPLAIEVSDYVEDSLPEGYTYIAVERGLNGWLGATCADISWTIGDPVPDNTGFVPNDLRNRVTWDDPESELTGGVLAATVTQPRTTEIVFQQDGKNYSRIIDGDIVFNDNVDFGTQEGLCVGSTESSVVAVATHEFGHFWGLGHSCEQNEVCTSQDLLDATMYWTGPACSDDQSTIKPDDIDGITALYGPYASFVCSNELDPDAEETKAFGIVPFEIKCQTISKSEAEITSVEWFWGDGGLTEGLDTTHTYEQAGNYTVKASFFGENDQCGEWDYAYNRIGYVRACGVPAAEFSYEHIDGLTYRLVNETDVTVYGCIFEIQWDIFDENGTLIDSVQAWEPDYTFPETGDYRVVLNVGGPAGTGAAELVVDARNFRGSGQGCSVVGPIGATGLGTVLFGLVLLRRRRRR